MNNRPSVLFRCDGSPEIGLGHVVRCLALADELQEMHDCRVAFSMRRGPVGFEMVRENGYPVLKPVSNDQSFDYGGWLEDVIADIRADALVLDVRSNLSRTAVEKWRSNGLLIATLDDPSERRLAADLAFYPPVPQVKKMDWRGFSGQLYSGWEWVVMRPEFRKYRKSQSPYPAEVVPEGKFQIPKVLVTMGGSDPAGMTLKVVKALDLLDEDFETIVVLGAGFSHRNALNDLITRTKRQFTIVENVKDMPGLMAQTDLAVASFGVTAYELAAMGIPAIHLCLTEDHAQSSSVFSDEGMAINLGVHTQITRWDLADTITPLLCEEYKREKITQMAKHKIDGHGAERIAFVIMTEIGENVHG